MNPASENLHYAKLSEHHKIGNPSCDFCDKPATRWAGCTSGRLCDQESCLVKFLKDFERHCQESLNE